MAIPSRPRTYVDSMILVYLHQGRADNKGERAKKFAERLRDQELQGVITYFTITEALSILIEGLARAINRALDRVQIERNREALETMVSGLGIAQYDNDRLTVEEGGSSLFERVDQIIATTTLVRIPPGEWKGLTGSEAIHLAFAERLDCDTFATFEDEFSSVGSVSSVSPMML